MTFDVNHPVLFLIAGLLIAVVLAQSVFFLVKALRRSKQLGMDQKKIRKTMVSAAIFTVAPAVAIVISVMVLSKTLGLPLPWLRLSVVGSMSYETVAATNALTAMGQDVYGERIAKSFIELDIDASHALRVSDCATSTYLYIADEKGEMALAISDMEICERITPAYLSANQQILQNAQVIVADTNIPAETLVYLAENCTAPIFCDPVSTIKAEKLRPILNKIHTLKPNRLEAELLSGVTIRNKADAEAAVKALLEKGVKRVFLSMGADGMYAATEAVQLWLPNIPGEMVNTTGCGDSAMGALVWAWMKGLDLESSVRAALAAGSITMESAETINPVMSATALSQRMSK